MAKAYEIVKDFDFSPKPGVVQSFTKGETRSNLTRACITKGNSLKALKPIKGDN